MAGFSRFPNHVDILFMSPEETDRLMNPYRYPHLQDEALDEAERQMFAKLRHDDFLKGRDLTPAGTGIEISADSLEFINLEDEDEGGQEQDSDSEFNSIDVVVEDDSGFHYPSPTNTASEGSPAGGSSDSEHSAFSESLLNHGRDQLSSGTNTANQTLSDEISTTPRLERILFPNDSNDDGDSGHQEFNTIDVGGMLFPGEESAPEEASEILDTDTDELQEIMESLIAATVNDDITAAEMPPPDQLDGDMTVYPHPH